MSELNASLGEVALDFITAGGRIKWWHILLLLLAVWSIVLWNVLGSCEGQRGDLSSPPEHPCFDRESCLEYQVWHNSCMNECKLQQQEAANTTYMSVKRWDSGISIFYVAVWCFAAMFIIWILLLVYGKKENKK